MYFDSYFASVSRHPASLEQIKTYPQSELQRYFISGFQLIQQFPRELAGTKMSLAQVWFSMDDKTKKEVECKLIQ